MFLKRELSIAKCRDKQANWNATRRKHLNDQQPQGLGNSTWIRVFKNATENKLPDALQNGRSVVEHL
jgi:hypothetical protein